MIKGYVRKIINFSSVDGPGNRTVIFLQGCNLNCLYCHNPETIPQYHSLLDEADQVKLMSVAEIIKQLEKLKDFIRGVTISGGECTLQFDFLLELVMALKKHNYEVFLDTNGYVDIAKMEQLISYVDYFMFDFKAFHETDHKKITGKSNRKIKRNIKMAGLFNKVYEIRTVVVPQLIDNKDNIEKTAQLIKSIDSNIRLVLIKYRPHGVREGLINGKTPTDEEMMVLKDIAQKKGIENIIIK
jgi:anaerobic ribonucleoside-triphosphate reductase activating protein